MSAGEVFFIHAERAMGNLSQNILETLIPEGGIDWSGAVHDTQSCPRADQFDTDVTPAEQVLDLADVAFACDRANPALRCVLALSTLYESFVEAIENVGPFTGNTAPKYALFELAHRLSFTFDRAKADAPTEEFSKVEEYVVNTFALTLRMLSVMTEADVPRLLLHLPHFTKPQFNAFTPLREDILAPHGLHYGKHSAFAGASTVPFKHQKVALLKPLTTEVAETLEVLIDDGIPFKTAYKTAAALSSSR